MFCENVRAVAVATGVPVWFEYANDDAAPLPPAFCAEMRTISKFPTVNPASDRSCVVAAVFELDVARSATLLIGTELSDQRVVGGYGGESGF